MTDPVDPESIIAYQGEPGAYSHLACQQVYPAHQARPCATFLEALHAVEQGQARYAMIPLENSTAGRVEEIYRQLPRTPLSIVAEHFQPINHCLLGVPGARLEQIRVVESHPQALAQCEQTLLALGLRTAARFDTAGAAQDVRDAGDPGRAAIASRLAGEIYGLEVLRENLQDQDLNTTRFVVFAREPSVPDWQAAGRYITSLMFRVRNIPAALYKALGGFATGGVNMVKLESYMGGNFAITQFYLDVEAHADEPRMRLALEELGFFAEAMRVLGTYPAHPARVAPEAGTGT